MPGLPHNRVRQEWPPLFHRQTLRFRQVHCRANVHTSWTETKVLCVPEIMFFPFYLDASRSYFTVAHQIKVTELALSSKIRECSKTWEIVHSQNFPRISLAQGEKPLLLTLRP